MVVCKDCGTTGRPARVTPGSILIEIVLWLCLFVPGLIYSLWRLSSRHDACATCGSVNIVPVDSPVGARLAEQNGYPPSGARSGAEEFGRKVGRLFARRR